MIDKDLLFIEILFLINVFIILFVKKNLYMKILFVILLFLFILLRKENYVYNKNKYLYITYGLIIILILFILTEYIKNIYYIVFVICSIIIYYYLSKILFNTTYGEVITNTKGQVQIKILDSFYKLNKIYTLPTTKTLKEKQLVLIELSKSPINKKPIKIIKVIKNERKAI
ncbi:MAG TPA: hypothetical protein P5513_01020 [Candidatus Diapherotrites archaeon]|nr:hypothetical protein [Candidatus Diapherotrites archaeon]